MEKEEHKPGRKHRKIMVLPPPRVRYYVGDPVVVIPLAKYERLANHLTDIALLGRKTQNEKAGVEARHPLILGEVRDDIRAAKRYYQITHTKDD